MRTILLADSVRICLKRRLYDKFSQGAEKRRKKNDKPVWTHFVSIHLQHKELSERYKELVEKIQALDTLPEWSRHPSIFVKPEKIHLTLSVLAIAQEEDQKLVESCLSEVVETTVRSLLEGHQVTATIRGLYHFGSDKQEVARSSVVYGKVQSETLQSVANHIADALERSGLANKRREKDVVLHMTLINTKYAKGKMKFKKIDVSEIIKQFGDYHFGDVEVDEIRICRMHGIDRETNGYPVAFSVKL